MTTAPPPLPPASPAGPSRSWRRSLVSEVGALVGSIVRASLLVGVLLIAIGTPVAGVIGFAAAGEPFAASTTGAIIMMVIWLILAIPATFVAAYGIAVRRTVERVALARRALRIAVDAADSLRPGMKDHVLVDGFAEEEARAIQDGFAEAERRMAPEGRSLAVRLVRRIVRAAVRAAYREFLERIRLHKIPDGRITLAHAADTFGATFDESVAGALARWSTVALIVIALIATGSLTAVVALLRLTTILL